MRFLGALLLSILPAFPVFAADYFEKAQLKEAIVSLFGGQLFFDVPVNMQPGTHQITVSGLVGDSEPQAEMPTGVNLLATQIIETHARRELPPASPEYLTQISVVEAARAALQTHSEQIEAAEAQRVAGEQKLALVTAMASGNSDIINLQSATDAGIVTTIIDQIGDAAAKAKSEISAAEWSLRSLAREGDRLERALELAEQNLDILKPVEDENPVVVLTVSVAEAVTGVIRFQMISDQMQWHPQSIVDLRQDGASGSLTITRQALVAQNTGTDWEDVTVSITTADLNRNSRSYPPRVDLRYLFDPEEMRTKSLARTSSVKADSFARAETLAAEPVLEDMAAAGFDLAGQVLTFSIPVPVDVLSDESGTVFTLDRLEYDVDLYARKTAARDQDTLLYTELVNETGAVILPSRGHLYRDGRYFGRIETDLVAPGDRFEIGLGPIDGLKIEKITLDRNDGDRGLLSGSQVSQNSYRITIESFLDYDIPLHLLDTLPVSQDEDLVIKDTIRPAPTERDYDGRRGNLKWILDVASGSTQSIALDYELRWPTGQEIGFGAKPRAN